MMSELDHIKELLRSCSKDQRREIFHYLRPEFAIHPIEEELNIQAEVILEAIHRAGDLTLRGIRGVIAQTAFEIYVVNELEGWVNEPVEGDPPYDFLIRDALSSVRIQVKMQRREKGRPKIRMGSKKEASSSLYVVETQRTRTGTSRTTGEKTRPYRFGEFDIIAVSMQASTNNWRDFMYSVGRWLLPHKDNEKWLATFQPVAAHPNDDWTDDLRVCIEWLRSGEEKKIKSWS